MWVHPCAEKKKRRKRQNKVSNPLGPNFCKAHISKLVCAPPFFLLSLQSPHQKVPKNAKTFFRNFLDPPSPQKKFFSGHASSKSAKLRSFLYSSPPSLADFDDAWPEKKIFLRGGGPKKCEKNFSHFWVLFDVDFAMKAKKTGVRIPFRDMGLAKIRSKRVGNFVLPFSAFFFLGTGVHPHPPPTTYWCQTNLNMIFGG